MRKGAKDCTQTDTATWGPTHRYSILLAAWGMQSACKCDATAHHWTGESKEQKRQVRK